MVTFEELLKSTTQVADPADRSIMSCTLDKS